MAEVLRRLHSYITKSSNEENETCYHEIGIVGDQLTVERAVNSLWQMSLLRMIDWKGCMQK